MCWELHLADEDCKIFEEIATTAQAIKRFGIEAVRFHDGSPPHEHDDYNYCLCPVDIEFLLDRIGYKLVEYPHPLWDSFNNVAVKSA